ncbi:uncharacterized protein EI90DRAFT_1737823 [Cantharellus anzutake]|uniref:uncharacterized protein n=1 Tax=Cantharellus anzutake TaxID=1750568 RepID=UPI001904ACEF|nr:uncharacterized protein EI90DRAFT_1737823 [Cantharellus anzutake]KAF8341439.1 hypothetical protein EI90DRAFT_1737823 [Cantharellus anzutake]
MPSTADWGRESSMDVSDSEDDFPQVEERRILDPVHDYVVFEPRVAAIIDTPQFQRLRYLKQLGTGYFVFPGASHNRFEHCLGKLSSAAKGHLSIVFAFTGVSHLARLMVENLRRRQPKLNVDDRDVLCVQIAGLVHDLGHGPFSHVFDGHFIPAVAPGTTWCHEEASELMFDSLLKENPHIQLETDWVEFIKDLVRGILNLSKHHEPPEKGFLFEIVANMQNGIDVDKFDYIRRDAINCGEQSRLATSRLINSCRVINGHICYDYKDHYNVWTLFDSRYSLHKRIYNHKTSKAIEYMVVDALIAAEPVLKIAERRYDPKKYLYLTDSVLDEIERSTDPALAGSRAILARLRRRDLYKLVESKVLPGMFRDLWKPHVTPESVAREAARFETDRGHESESLVLNASDIIVDWATLHCGMKDKDPMQLVRFYSKQSRNRSFVVRVDEGSFLLPNRWEELQLRVYTRDPKKQILAQTAFRALLSKLPDETGSSLKEITLENPFLYRRLRPIVHLCLSRRKSAPIITLCHPLWLATRVRL